MLKGKCSMKIMKSSNCSSAETLILHVPVGRNKILVIRYMYDPNV